MSESLVATRDPVLQRAAQIAGFAEAMVQDTDAGKVVLCRHRRARQWVPFGHLEPGECALSVFYGTAFWERADVIAMYRKQEEQRASSILSVKSDVSKDFRRDLQRQISKRVDGKNDLLEFLAGRRRA